MSEQQVDQPMVSDEPAPQAPNQPTFLKLTPQTSAEEVPISAAAPASAEMEAMQARLQQLQEEASKLESMQQDATKSSEALQEDQEEIDARSIYVGNVDYGATPQELEKHFEKCGSVQRVTILMDKFTGSPKGYAYIEFAEPKDVAQAVTLNDSEFRQRQLKVNAKRTNIPGFKGGRGGRGGRGRGGRGGGFRGRGGFRGGRGGGRGGYAPY